jgi:hypothetical protein
MFHDSNRPALTNFKSGKNFKNAPKQWTAKSKTTGGSNEPSNPLKWVKPDMKKTKYNTPGDPASLAFTSRLAWFNLAVAGTSGGGHKKLCGQTSLNCPKRI